MNKPKVSILIPCYNSEKYLGETLQSCINQDYSNIEIIIVDDGSTDNSYEVAERWANKYEIIHLYSQQNSGVCRARNYALKLSTGEYVVYVDADDIISPQMISSQVNVLETEDDFTIATSAWGRFYSSTSDFRLENQKVYKDYENPVCLIEDLLNGGMFGLSCYLTPRRLLILSGEWNEDLTINTDGEYFIRVLSNASKIKHSHGGFLYYRSNNLDSISRCTPNVSKGKSLLNSYELIYSYLNNRGLLTPKICSGLKKEIQSVAYQYARYVEIEQNAHHLADKVCNVSTIPNVGSLYFKSLCHILGFWNALYIKQILKK